MSHDLAYAGQEKNPVEGRGGDGSARRAAAQAGGGKPGLGAPHHRSGSTSKKEWNPFFSCTGEENDPARVVVIKNPAAACKAKVSAAGHALSCKPSKALEGLLPRAFAKPTSASHKHKKAEQEGDDNTEVAFSVPPSVKAALTRCAAQGRERAASGGAPAARDGRGIRNANLAASARSGGMRPSPVTPSLTPYAAEHVQSTVSASSEEGATCQFFATSSAYGGGEGSSDPVSVGVGGCDGDGDGDGDGDDGGDVALASGVGGSSTGDEGREGASCSSGETRSAGGEDEVDVNGRRICHPPEAPTGVEPLLGRPSGKDQPMDSGDIDRLLTRVLAADGGDENRAGVDERSDGSGGALCAPTTSVSVSLRDLEDAFPSEEKAPVAQKKASQVLVGMSEKSKAVSKAVTSPFRRRRKETTTL